MSEDILIITASEEGEGSMAMSCVNAEDASKHLQCTE